jgi:hypothetical protein
MTPASECWFCICRSAKGGGGGRSIRLEEELDERSRVCVSTSGLWCTSEVARGSEGPASVISISVSRAACSGVRSWMMVSPVVSSVWGAVGVGAMTPMTGLAAELLEESWAKFLCVVSMCDGPVVGASGCSSVRSAWRGFVSAFG